MPRKGYVVKREVPPDKIYGDRLVAKTINVIMKRGKKSLAERIFYRALDLVKEKTGEDPLKVFRKGIENCKPVLEVKSRRVGGATYQVPVEVRPERRVSLAIRWLVGYARERNEKSMIEKLANEIIDAANNKGGAVKKREDVHKMAEANRAFAHYRW